MVELQLHDIIVDKSTIISRLNRKSYCVNKQNNKTTPLLEIEPLLIPISLWKQEAGQPITPSKDILLENLLIDGKSLQESLARYQSSIKASLTETVSARFW